MIDSNSHRDSLKVNAEADDKNEIDCVMFVFDHCVLDAKEYATKMKAFYDIANSKGSPTSYNSHLPGKITAVAVTKLDESDKNLKLVTDYPMLHSKFSIDEHFNAIKNFLVTAWENETLPIFPVINYVSGDFSGKKPWIEKTGENALMYFLDQQKKRAANTAVAAVKFPKDDPVNHFEGEPVVIVPFSAK